MIDLNGASVHQPENRLGNAARRYVSSYGMAVFACRAREKEPLDLCDECAARLPGYAPQSDHKVCRGCGAVYEKKNPRGFYTATRDVAKVEAWWSAEPDANIGIRTGDGLVVLDVDGEEGEKSLAALEAVHGPLPETPQQTTGKGRHFFFSAPHSVKCSASKIGPKLDVKADGGYIIAAPSMHPNGKRYTWVEGRKLSDLPIAQAPEWLLGPLERPKAKAPAASVSQRADTGSISEAYVRRAVEGEYQKVATATDARNTALNAATYALGGLVGAGALDETTARQVLEAAADACGLLQDERDKTLKLIPRVLAKGIENPRDLSRVGASRRQAGDQHARQQHDDRSEDHRSEEAREERPADAPQGHSFRGEWLKDISYQAEPELVEGLLPSTGLGFLYGPSSAGKSFIAIDWGLCLASGAQVLDRPTLPSGVLYIAAEGQAGLRKRLVAARRQRDLDDVELPFNYLPAFINLADPKGEEVERVLAFARECSAEMEALGAPLRFVVIDTMAAASPGVDENTAKDMGPLIFRLQKLAADLNCLVLVVAHVGKDEARGLRGWSGSRAAADVAIECRIEREDEKLRESPVTRRYVWFEKAKDGPCGFTLADYHLRNVEVGRKQSGLPDTTCWVEYAVPAPAKTGSSVADMIEAQARAQAHDQAQKERILDAITEHLSENWISMTDTASKLRYLAGIKKPGENTMLKMLRSMASDQHEGIVTIDRPTGQIEILTIVPSLLAHAQYKFRVVGKATEGGADEGLPGGEPSTDGGSDDQPSP